MKNLKMIPRTVVWYIHAVLSLVFIILPQMIRLSFLRKKLPELEFFALAHKIAGKWAKAQLKWSGAKISITGIENIPDCPVVFIANHQSYIDIGIFLALIEKPKGFVAKVELKKAPIVNTFMDYIGCLFMDRNNLKQSLKTIIDGANRVKNGHSLVIFPEGTRSKSNNMLEWKAGALKLATKAKAPIVPVTLYNSFEILEADGYKIKPCNVEVIIGEPVYTENLPQDELTELPNTIKGIIQENLQNINYKNRLKN